MGTDAPRNLAGARITVMGLGRFGGGVGVTRWLAEQGADLLVTDLDPAEKLADSIAQIQALIDRGTVKLRLGEHNVSDFTDTDLVVANPAVPKPWENRFLRAATAAGVPITTEIRLLTERLPADCTVIGITGSAGKSTTTSMIAHAMRKLAPTYSPESKVYLGGNIGGSLLAEISKIKRGDFVVLELSSAMLYWLGRGVGYEQAEGWSPDIAVVTNILPNHLDWHGSFEHYCQSKSQIGRHPRSYDRSALVVPVPRPACLERFDIDFEDHCFDVYDPQLDSELHPWTRRLPLPGAHNRMNANMAAHATAAAFSSSGGWGVTDDDLKLAREAMLDFTGLAHRLQLVGIFNTSCGTATRGVRVYNDSKSTTPESAALAVAALDEEPSLGAKRVHLICGGYDKKVDLKLLCDAGARCAAVYTVGVTGPIIAAGVRAAGGTAHECETIAAATARAANEARDAEAILLSPGCASWDQFTNFEARGELFIREIERVLKPLST